MNHILDIIFHILHILIICINIFGWIFKRTRRLNLIVLLLTLFSWFGLGLFYGLGYCPLTDWHWDVKRSLGQTNLPNSYIKLMLDSLTGYNWSPDVVDIITFISFFSAFGFSCGLNYRDYKKRY